MSEEVQADFITHLMNGNNAMHREELDAAVEAYTRALEQNPNFALIYTKLGQALYKKQQYEDAISCFKKSLELTPGHRETLYRLAMAYEAGGQSVKAAVIYDNMEETAREKEQETAAATGDEKKKKSRRRSSSAKTLRSLKTSEILPLSLGTLAKHPLLAAPALAGIFISVLTAKAIEPLAALVPGDNTGLNSITGFVTSATPINAASVVYAIAIFAVAAMVCTPLFASVTILTRFIYRGKQASFGTALAESFAQISPLLSVAIVGACAVAAALAGGIFVFDLFSTVIYELGGMTVSLRPLGLLAAPLAGVYFIYAVPSIVIDKRGMESSMKKSSRIANRYFLKTAGTLYFVLLVYTLLLIVLSPLEFAGLIAAHLLIAPVATFALIHFTMIFTIGQEPKKIEHRETHGSFCPPHEKENSGNGN